MGEPQSPLKGRDSHASSPIKHSQTVMSSHTANNQTPAQRKSPNFLTSKTSVISRNAAADLNVTPVGGRRKSRLSTFDNESVQYANNNAMQFTDPFGLAASGNLPKIAEAFR